MEITGKIIQKLDAVRGTSSRTGNEWHKQEYVLETMEAYPRKVFFNFFGERADQYPLEVGQVITLSFDLESREYNGRWYTDVRGWKAEPAQMAAQPGAPAPAPAQQAGYQPAAAPMQPAAPLPDFSQPAAGDDLPF